MRQTWRAELSDFYAAHADSAKRLAYLLTGDKELAEDPLASTLRLSRWTESLGLTGNTELTPLGRGFT